MPDLPTGTITLFFTDIEGVGTNVEALGANNAKIYFGRMHALNLVGIDVDEAWFAFHTDESEHEEKDTRALEELWARVHSALPELGAGAEVLETATPRTIYERTRRKLGMVGGVGQSLEAFGANALTHRTTVENLFMVGDTVFPGNGVAAVTHSALVVADEIAPPRAGRR